VLKVQTTNRCAYAWRLLGIQILGKISHYDIHTYYFSQFLCFRFAAADLVEIVQRYSTYNMYSFFLPIVAACIEIHKYCGKFARGIFPSFFFNCTIVLWHDCKSDCIPGEELVFLGGSVQMRTFEGSHNGGFLFFSQYSDRAIPENRF
jgi:hypothetical protein